MQEALAKDMKELYIPPMRNKTKSKIKYGRSVKHSVVRHCDEKCCSIFIEPFKWEKKWVRDKNDSNFKAGIFIYDSSSSKILLIQSCGYLWGPPKGGLKKLELIEDGAIREVLEETGISIPLEAIIHQIPIYMKKRSYYYILDIKECKVKVQKTEGNDANGITWIKTSCLHSLCNKNGEYKLTKHCKLLIQRVFGMSLNNRTRSCPLLSSSIVKNIIKDKKS